MRLICPNCGATYEVPDDVIPETGRDVQCSSCGHTWFERPGASEAAEHDDAPEPGSTREPDRADEQAPTPEPATAADPAREAAAEPARGSAPDIAAAPTPDSDSVDVAASEESADEPQEDTPRRQPLSPEAAEILREEVAREQAARRGETLESQPDLGLEDRADTALPREQEARRNVARLQGEPVAPVPPASGSRGDLLPDIDEINSSLRPDGAEEAPDSRLTETERAEKVKRRGFRIGFFLVGGIALIGALIYAQSDRIAAAAPSVAPTLDAYVAQVDEARLWLDLRMQALIADEPAAE